ncbi:MAG: 23S rRNA (uracil(1939)-C(5))-methyltransferase RlmD [Firmicutes bacterium]|nr:23S rRNA (uracil(1939)-C(5))-methyltransferase RlmD [Bacillota bacterium]
MDTKIEVIGVDLSQEGEGIAKTEGGYTVFVPYLLPGEKAYIKYTQKGKRYAKGEILEIQESSPMRTKAPCPVYYECGGCQLQHFEYSGQLKWKEKKVKDSLIRLAEIKNPKINPIIGMDNPWHYRNRGQFVIGEKEGKLRYGFYSPKSHSIVSFAECPIHHSFVNKALKGVLPELEGFHSFFENKGVLRHLALRCGEKTGEVLATVVVSEPLPKTHRLDCSSLDGVVGIVENINKSRSSKVFGEKERVIWGKDHLEERLLGLRFKISSQSFFQNNTSQAEKLYSLVLKYANVKGKKVIDLYSGIGSITLVLAKEAKDVLGVEIVKAAVRDAEANARLNQNENVHFKAIDAADAFKQEKAPPDVLVVDPPRKGMEKRVIEDIVRFGPQRIVYVSCNPDTLARDIKLLEGNYNFIEATPVDMFPQTTHVETVVLMSRVNK